MRLFFVPSLIPVQPRLSVGLDVQGEPLEYLEFGTAGESAQLSSAIDGELQEPGERLHDPLLAALVFYRLNSLKCEIHASRV